MIITINAIGYLFTLLTLVSCTDEAQAVAPAGSFAVSGTLPVLYIDTEKHEPIVSKEVYLNASYRLDPMGTEGIEALGTVAAPLPMQIRGRGHSSWKGAKKPYKIKLGK